MNAVGTGIVFGIICLVLLVHMVILPNINKRAKKKKIFIICPVRNVDESTKEKIHKYVTDLEKHGHTVHWPSRDTNQNDPIGLNICSENREGIYTADEVHVWFDTASQGSLFDIGMTFAFLRTINKKVVLINKDQISPTSHKSFQNVLLELTKAP